MLEPGRLYLAKDPLDDVEKLDRASSSEHDCLINLGKQIDEENCTNMKKPTLKIDEFRMAKASRPKTI